MLNIYIILSAMHAKNVTEMKKKIPCPTAIFVYACK